MASAKMCDRCGKYYSIYNNTNDKVKVNGFMYLNIDKAGKYWSHNSNDLCPECMKQLKDWFLFFQNKEESENE